MVRLFRGEAQESTTLLLLRSSTGKLSDLSLLVHLIKSGHAQHAKMNKVGTFSRKWMIVEIIGHVTDVQYGSNNQITVCHQISGGAQVRRLGSVRTRVGKKMRRDETSSVLAMFR